MIFLVAIEGNDYSWINNFDCRESILEQARTHVSIFL